MQKSGGLRRAASFATYFATKWFTIETKKNESEY